MKNRLKMLKLVIEYRENMQISKALETRRAEILSKLNDLTNGLPTIIGDYKFTAELRKANAPYKKIVEALLPKVDLDAWRGPAKISYALREAPRKPDKTTNLCKF